jgi:hypothetical protein
MVTGCILLSHVESRDIVERGLSDVNMPEQRRIYVSIYSTYNKGIN